MPITARRGECAAEPALAPPPAAPAVLWLRSMEIGTPRLWMACIGESGFWSSIGSRSDRLGETAIVIRASRFGRDCEESAAERLECDMCDMSEVEGCSCARRWAKVR